MPYAIDEDKLNDPSVKVLDISKPPMKLIPHQEFPRMVYLHPVDKTKAHKEKIVQNPEQLQDALKVGYRVQPHVPATADEPELESGEYETEVKRGPGRPRTEVA